MTISSPRRLLARLANAGIVLFGLALLIVLGTGGTRIDLGFTEIGLRGLWRPLQGFALFAALRLLASRRTSGIEGAIVSFFARQGMVPRHLPATALRALRTGGILGAGLGVAIGLADASRVAVSAGRPGLSPPELAAIGFVGTLTGALCGLVFGAVCALLVHAVARGVGQQPGRYELGRWILALLLALDPALVRFATPAGLGAGRSTVLITSALAFCAGVFLVGLVLPTVILRALDGSWGLAIGGGGLLALLLGLGAIGWLGTHAGRGGGGDSSYPNVLLVTVSGLRADALGSYGAIGELTPQIDQLANRGARLADAVTPSTGLAPAAASLLTGQYPWAHRLRATDGRLALTGAGLPALLTSYGYSTAAFVSTRRLDGRATRFAEMFSLYDDPTRIADWVARLALARMTGIARENPPDAIRPGQETAGAFRDWLAGSPSAPWFAWVEIAELLHPHPVEDGAAEIVRTPWAALARRDAPPARVPVHAEGRQRAASERAWVAGYARAVQTADAVVGDLLANLAARGELARTVVIVTAERGSLLGEEGLLFDPAGSLARGAIHVPLIIAGPAVAPAVEVRGPASLVDLLPTLAGLIRVGPTRPVEGEDLSRYLLAGEQAERALHAGPVFAETPAAEGRARSWVVRLGPWKLLERPDGSQQLFVVSAAGELPLREIRGRNERLRQELADLLARQRARASH